MQKARPARRSSRQAELFRAPESSPRIGRAASKPKAEAQVEKKAKRTALKAVEATRP